jgi:transposase
MATYIGIDISKDTFDAATSEQKQSIIFKNTVAGYKKFKTWVSKFNEPHVCMEATGKYYLGLATSLYQQGVSVSVVNPLRTRFRIISAIWK